MNKAITHKVNWAGAGPSLAWIAFFIVCMFIRTNFPSTRFATTFLADTRIIWTLIGSFVVMLAFSMVISALLSRTRDAAPSSSTER
jgi:membrane-bound acyltransferase YfiQ involved in biofilm formation